MGFRRFGAYLLLHGKKGIKLFPKVLLGCVFSVLILALLAGLFFMGNGHGEGKQKLKVGVVGQMDNNYLGYGLTILQTADSSRYTLDLVECTETEAMEKLQKGEFRGYILIPEGWMEAMMSGANDKPIRYVVPEGQTGIAAVVMEAIADTVSDMVLSAQEASVATWYAMETEDFTPEEYREVMRQMDLDLLSMALQRGEIYETKIQGVSAGRGYGVFYFGTVLMFLLILTGVWMGPYFLNRREGFYTFAQARGVYPAAQILGEGIPYTLVLLGVQACLFVLLSGGIAFVRGKMPELFTDGGELAFLKKTDMAEVFVRLLPAFLVLALWQFFLYETVHSVAAALMLQFLSALLMCYVSGYFYPSEFFPEVMQKAGNVLPAGLWKDSMLRALSGEPLGGCYGLCLLYGCFLLFLLVILRNGRIRKGERG